MFCQNCGAALSNNDKFCMSCGTPVQAVVPRPFEKGGRPVEPDIRYQCKQCGFKFDEQFGVCPQCGTLVGMSRTVDGASPVLSDPITPPVPTVASVKPVSTPDKQQPVSEILNDEEKKKRFPWLLIVLIVGGLVLASVIGFFVCKSINSDNGDVYSNSNPASSQAGTPSENLSSEPEVIEVLGSSLAEAINGWTLYTNRGVCCEMKFAYGDNSVWDRLTEEQRQWVSDIGECTCCNTIAEAKAHVARYLSPELCAGMDESILIENNGLSCLLGAKGYIQYNLDDIDKKITRTAYNKVEVTTNLYGSGGQYICRTKFEFEYINGSYLIVKVTDLPEDPNTKSDFTSFARSYYDGDQNNGPCYCLDILSIDKENNVKFNVVYVGYNASPYYETGEITAKLDQNGKTTFNWSDSWGNKGEGTFTLIDSATPSVSIMMIVTDEAESNRASLDTHGSRVLYP